LLKHAQSGNGKPFNCAHQKIDAMTIIFCQRTKFQVNSECSLADKHVNAIVLARLTSSGAVTPSAVRRLQFRIERLFININSFGPSVYL